jgi:uncharacterized membrane protein
MGDDDKFPTEPPPPYNALEDDEQKPKRKGSVGPRSFRGRIAAGILIVIPLAVTAFLVKIVFDWALKIGVRVVYFMSYAIWTISKTDAPPKWIDPEQAAWYEICIAVVLTVLMFYLLGWLGTNVAGRQLIGAAEALLERIPFIDTIYGSIKRMVWAMFGSANQGDSDKRVVMIDFPTENMKTIGFVTNTFTDLNTGNRYACVYVPTTPNPTSGYMEVVPIERITETDLTMEQALSMVLSGGATSPTEMRMKIPNYELLDRKS